MWKLSEIQISVSINEVLLEDSRIHSCIYGLWLLSHDSSWAALWWGPYGLQSLKYLLSGSLQKKFANACFSITDTCSIFTSAGERTSLGYTGQWQSSMERTLAVESDLTLLVFPLGELSKWLNLSGPKSPHLYVKCGYLPPRVVRMERKESDGRGASKC